MKSSGELYSNGREEKHCEWRARFWWIEERIPNFDQTFFVQLLEEKAPSAVGYKGRNSLAKSYRGTSTKLIKSKKRRATVNCIQDCYMGKVTLSWKC